MGWDIRKLSMARSLGPALCVRMCVMCVCSGQHLAHSPLMMSMPDDVMVSITKASVVGFGVSIWREEKRREEKILVKKEQQIKVGKGKLVDR